MMYELLTGKQPFGGETMAALMYQITNSKQPDVTSRCASAPPCVGAIVDKLLEKDPNNRFQTGAELKQALTECMNALR
jgi:serine/threonine protein kinase